VPRNDNLFLLYDGLLIISAGLSFPFIFSEHLEKPGAREQGGEKCERQGAAR
jgi:hypothetical protein